MAITAAMVKEMREKSGAGMMDAKKALTEKGMQIVAPSPKLMADMKQVGTIMLADWQKRAGADGEAIITAFNQSAKSAAKKPAAKAQK